MHTPRESATKNIPIGESIHARLLAQAQKEGRTIRVITERLIAEGLDRPTQEATHA